MRISSFVASVALLLLACSKDNESPSSGDASTGTATGAFACIGKVTGPQPTQAEVTFSAGFVELTTGNPVTGVNVTMCPANDVACATPIKTGASGADGNVSFVVPVGTTGFAGYGKIELAGYVSQINTANPPAASNQAAPFRVTMVSESAFNAFLSLAGVTNDVERGHVALRALDCDGKPAKDVTFTLGSGTDANTKLVYVTPANAVSTVTQTDDSGRAVFFNVQPGLVTATATLTTTQQKIGSIQLVVAKGFVTASSFPPTP